MSLTEADAIVEAAEDVIFERYHDWSRDQLLIHPIESLRVCVEVRRKLRRRDLAPHEILGPWLAAHKRGAVKRRRRRSTKRSPNGKGLHHAYR